ncbi:hypothetical protein [Arthrobacter psychrochitiniphilus]|uniref:hypothetical protein n=1 Tax=Arthrobacter psychrochitiniphilus TaxID=291045 RepID=UPI0011B5BFF3|nr:hypothetical protein [Arthrobacter psychrochitiniphilus]NYG17441.1 hypothetical protein [Arthrobacter psychrochitiniphilus]
MSGSSVFARIAGQPLANRHRSGSPWHEIPTQQLDAWNTTRLPRGGFPSGTAMAGLFGSRVRLNP